MKTNAMLHTLLCTALISAAPMASAIRVNEDTERAVPTPCDGKDCGLPNPTGKRPATQQSNPSAFNGLWEGEYSYPQNSSMPSVPFSAVLQFTPDGNIKGSIIEPNTFGDQNSPHLSAKVQGVWRGNAQQPDTVTVSWVKTYDGTGGVSHSVRYSAGLRKKGNSFTITGIWEINASGTFVLRKITPVMTPKKSKQ